jgi:hypothetical protein
MDHLFAIKQRSSRWMLACLVTAWGGSLAIAAPAAPAAANPSPVTVAEGAQGRPDIVGIFTGIPLEEAVALMKKHNPQIQVRYSSDHSAEGTAKLETKTIGRREVETRETILLSATMDAPHRVISVTRKINGLFEEGPTHQQFLEKYGPPTKFAPVRRVGGVVPTSPEWHYDASGHACPPTQSGLALPGCEAALTVEMKLTGNLPMGANHYVHQNLYARMVDLVLHRADADLRRDQAKARRDKKVQEIREQADRKLKL